MTVLLCVNKIMRRLERSSQCTLTYTLYWKKAILHLINYHFMSMMLERYCVFAGNLSEVKTEAGNNDMTEHPHLDTTRPYLCTVCHKR